LILNNELFDILKITFKNLHRNHDNFFSDSVLDVLE
jgi:hypothetical protein